MRALMFPGQGSQAVGMGCDLFDRHEVVRETYATASAALGYDIAPLCFGGPAERLSQTDVTQPALLTHSVAVLRLLQQRGLRFDVALGHSLGEYSALVATGALAFPAAIDLVRRRGEAMEAAGRGHPGGMVAVLGLEDAVVEELCGDLAEVWPANFNSPGQVVVSGTRAALRGLTEVALAAGARKVIPLAVSGAFHSPFMSSAAEELGVALRTASWNAPHPRFFSVTEVGYVSDGFADLLIRQVTTPVRFTQSVRRLAAEGINACLEVGPGAVLCGLTRRITPEIRLARCGDVESVEALAPDWFDQ